MEIEMILILAIVLGMAGSYLLYLSWKRHSTPFAISGWACLLATFPFWIMAVGPEYGSVFALSLPAIYVWAGITNEQKRQPLSNPISKPNLAISWKGKKVLRNSGYVFYHLILLMLISGLLAATFADFIPATRPAQLASGIITLPLIWSGLSFWHLVAHNKRLPLLASLLGSIASGVYLFV